MLCCPHLRRNELHRYLDCNQSCRYIYSRLCFWSQFFPGSTERCKTLCHFCKSCLRQPADPPHFCCWLCFREIPSLYEVLVKVFEESIWCLPPNLKQNTFIICYPYMQKLLLVFLRNLSITYFNRKSEIFCQTWQSDKISRSIKMSIIKNADNKPTIAYRNGWQRSKSLVLKAEMF